MVGVTEDRALGALRDEADALSRVVTGLGEAEWGRPTRCEPWSVRELLGHVRVAVGWLPEMLSGPAPDRAEVTAVRYYRPGDRFSPQGNAARIGLARDLAAGHPDGAALAADFTETWQRACRLCRDEPGDRVVRTRHGDAMLLSQFVITRVIEVAVHGLDLADALGRAPWLTSRAAEVALDLIMGSAHRGHLRDLGWDEPNALRKVTGRATLTAAEAGRVERLGVNWITLG